MSQSSLTRGIARPGSGLAKDGTVPIPDTPGIGVEVDLDFVTTYRVN